MKKVKEYRIYVNNKLEACCYTGFAYINNLNSLKKQYGEEGITVRMFDKVIFNKEKEDWIQEKWEGLKTQLIKLKAD